MYRLATHLPTWARSVWLVPTLIGLSACSLRPPSISVPGPAELTMRVRSLLSTTDDRSPAEYRRARVELEQMGPEIDTVLVSLAFDPTARSVARANALVLLADRRSPAALSTLRWALLTAEDDLVRSAAVMGLHRFAAESAEAANAIRSAVSDPSPRVRLNALQALDVHDVQTIRELLRREADWQVEAIARQLVLLAEARGAPLARDENGVYRTTAAAHTRRRLLFRPELVDERSQYARGSLGWESLDGAYFPLADGVEMVRGVLPAFFSPDRTAVVIEAARHILIRDLEQREAIYLGRGTAPRLIPFTDAFVFVREMDGTRRDVPGGTQIRYEVIRAEFADGATRRIGELTVVASPHEYGYLSPVRWMSVGETGDGWVLRIDGTTIFHLPHHLEAADLRPTAGQ